jgi:CHAD domain-containing protein
MTERELKLALPGRFAIPPLILGDESLTPLALPDLSLRATYYDTADLRLARHGVTLRYRRGEDGGATWTLKLPEAPVGPVLARNEIHLDGPAREPPALARTLTTAYTRGAPFVAVATLRTRRRRTHLVEPETEEPVAELAIDEVSVVEGSRVVSRFRELELEDLRGDVDLPAIADQLLAAGATVAEPIPKVVRALGSRATAPPDNATPPIEDDATLADAVRVAIADALQRLVTNDPLARLDDAEGIHQVRVAVRRLRSDLHTLGDAVDADWRAAVAPRLRDLAMALAAARDLDVLIERLRSDALATSSTLRGLFTELEQRRGVARADLLVALEAPDYPALLDELVRAVGDPPAGTAGAGSVADELPALAMAAWRRFERRASRLDAEAPDEAFHHARIGAKRARYASELAARMLGGKRGDAAAKLAARIANAQDVLGIVQDASVAEAAIRESLDGRGRGVAYGFEAGRLVERQRMRASEARSAFLAEWKSLRRRKWRTWAE